MTRHAQVKELQTLANVRRVPYNTGGSEMRFDKVIVVLDGALQLRHLPGTTEVLRHGPSVNVYAICVDNQLTSRLPELYSQQVLLPFPEEEPVVAPCLLGS